MYQQSEEHLQFVERNMQHVMIILLFLTVCVHGAVALETEVIQTNSGKVQGDIEPTLFDGKYVQKFLNIPYAEAPVGKLRFAKPEPKKPWNGILKNSNITVACWQSAPDSTMMLSEDCLVLNIWTPYPQKQNLSVMIWIHGGGYAKGMGNSYIGYNFVAVGQVILVTINFRLSLLGFLTSGDDRIKGNFGLYDQRLAMKWVKENIAKFGGNPESITIFGTSSGGASVSAHTLSQDSWPYFNRAISQSGLISMSWTRLGFNEDIQESFSTFLKSINCDDDGNLLDCLRNDTSDYFLKNVTESIALTTDFGPWVDGEFLTDEPQILLNENKVKSGGFMLGVTKDEAYIFRAQDLLKQTRNVSLIKNIHEQGLKDTFQFFPEAVVDQALELYKSECTSSFIEVIRPMVDFASDFGFTCPTVNEANLRAQLLVNSSADVYMYRYSFASVFAMVSFLSHEDTHGFVRHGSDIHSLFGDPIKDQHFPAEDQILSMRMILYWTNFAKNGNPNVGTTQLPVVFNHVDNLPKWPKYTDSAREYLDMESLSRMIVRDRLRETHCEFLKDPESFTNKTRNVYALENGTSSSRNGAQQRYIPRILLLFSAVVVLVITCV